MDKDEELKKLKRLKNLIENTYKDNLRFVLIDEYMNYKSYLIDCGVLKEECFNDDESSELIEDQDINYERLNNSAYNSLFDNFELIEDITNKIEELHKKIPINYYYDYSINLKKISLNDAIEIRNSFFKSLGNDVLNVFLSLQKNENINLSSNDMKRYTGLCYNLSICDNPRIIIKPNNNSLKFYSILSHELGHSYEFIRNKTNKRKFVYNFLVEVPSIVFEKLFNIYLINNNYYKELGIFSLFQCKNAVLNMNSVNQFINKEYKNNLVFIDKEKLYYLYVDDSAFDDLSEDMIAKIDYYGTDITNYGYVLSDIIANNLIVKYLSNKKEGLKEIKDFITTMYQYSVSENLNRYAKDLQSTEMEMKELYNYQKKKFYL